MKNQIRYYLSLMLIFSLPIFGQVTNTVTFKADITDLKTQGFVAGVHTLRVEGLNWDNSNIAVDGDRNMTPDPNNPNIYVAVLTVSTPNGVGVGDSARYKFKGGPDTSFQNSGWESGDPVSGYDGRAYVFKANSSIVTLTAVEPRLQMLQLGTGLQNVVTFQANLSAILGTGAGFFDPTTDSIEVRGFWADASTTNIKDGYLVSGTPRMEFLNPTSFIVATTLTIELPSGSKPGDGTGFKFKASPDSKFSNTGWETTANRTYTFQANNANVTLDPVIPNITALKGPLTSDVKVLFQIHLPDGAENRYDHSLIPLDKVEFAILKGADKSMGSWQGNWTITDTVATDSLCVILNDKGINGDKVAGDHIWSAWVTFKAGTEQGATPYKYGVWYPGCSSITGASGAPLDDAAPSGQDMSYMIKQSSQPLEELDIWPTVVTSVRSLNGVVAKEYKLNQNYPNPFNPETTIRYSLKHAGLTQVEVYNILGEKVVTLVNGVQNAGTYEVKFSGNNLPSGIYFYSINTSEYRATKKMLLLK